LKFAPMEISAMALLQQHNAWRDNMIEPAARWRAAIEALVHSKLGAQSGRKNNRLVCYGSSLGDVQPRKEQKIEGVSVL